MSDELQELSPEQEDVYLKLKGLFKLMSLPEEQYEQLLSKLRQELPEILASIEAPGNNNQGQ